MVDLSLGVLPSAGGSWPIYVSQEPNDPDKAITVYDTAGLQQGRFMNTGEVQERDGIIIRVRSPNHTDGFIKANAIATTLDQSVQTTEVTISSTTYCVYSISRASGPIALGKEVPTNKRDIFTLNITAQIHQTS